MGSAAFYRGVFTGKRAFQNVDTPLIMDLNQETKEVQMMKLGILGTGKIVKAVLPLIRELSLESVYILGRESNRRAAEELCQAYQLDRCFFDYDQMLASDVDTIYVALPNALHFSYGKKAVERHKNVIIEKPITANVRELEELTALAPQRQVCLIEAMNIHYLPAYQKLKEHLPDIGRLRVVSMNYSQYSSRYDAFKRGDILPAFDPEKADGALMDLNVYNLHALVGLYGAPETVQYTANVERGIDTSGVLTLRYPDFVAVCVAAKDCKAPVCCTLQGDAGAIQIDCPMNQMTGYRFVSNDGGESVCTVENPEHRLSYEFREFLDMIENKDEKRISKMLQISLTVSRIMEQARRQEGIVFRNDG